MEEMQITLAHKGSAGVSFGELYYHHKLRWVNMQYEIQQDFVSFKYWNNNLYVILIGDEIHF